VWQIYDDEAVIVNVIMNEAVNDKLENVAIANALQLEATWCVDRLQRVLSITCLSICLSIKCLSNKQNAKIMGQNMRGRGLGHVTYFWILGRDVKTVFLTKPVTVLWKLVIYR